MQEPSTMHGKQQKLSACMEQPWGNPFPVLPTTAPSFRLAHQWLHYRSPTRKL